MELRERGRCACRGVPLPWPLSAWSPVNGTPISRSGGGGPPIAQSSLEHPDHGRAAGQEELGHVTWSPSLPALRLPPAASLLGGALPKYYSTLRSTVQGGLGALGSAGEGERSQKTRALAHSTLIYNPGTQLSLGVQLPKKLEWGHEGLLPPGGRFL